MKPIAAAALAGALISGVVMYAVGARTATVDASTMPLANQAGVVETGAMTGVVVDAAPAIGQSALAPQALAAAPATQLVSPAVSQPAPQAVAAPAPVRTVVVERAAPKRSWKKTALVIGASAASGAGVGGIVKGKKGALIGAALGGGVASIYEATKR